ncbi:hypothetical protein HanPI659440_Chr17g0699491 [Helianthus annuus]|nr:hypothetical protein HanPI659440_Chr17g0699491 [Helianthus annuus]
MVFHCCEKFSIVLYLGKATFPVRDGSGVRYANIPYVAFLQPFVMMRVREASIASILELMEFWQGAWFSNYCKGGVLLSITSKDIWSKTGSSNRVANKPSQAQAHISYESSSLVRFKLCF